MVDQLPLVSCVMPTANRRRFVPQAIAYFQRQDYPNRELVILDDGADSVVDLIPDDPQIRYVRLPGKRTLGRKRNECVEHSRGDLILHWDDDDWMASHRIRYQVEALLAANAEVCGLRQMLFYDLRNGGVWLYHYTQRKTAWLAGGSLLYTRAFWKRSPFPDMQVASDTRFILNQRLERSVVLPDYRFYVAMIHPGNTSRKMTQGVYWSRWNSDIKALMGDDYPFYQPAAPAKPASITVKSPPAPTYAVLMVVHNAREIVKIATQRVLHHIEGQDARLTVVDNASDDGVQTWLDLLAARGDIDLIRCPTNLGHGAALELARQQTRSPYLVTLDSDAFPLRDDWLDTLRAMLTESVKVAGIRHHRDYIHPSCLMIARETLDAYGLTFLNEKHLPSRFDVAERLSHALRERGFDVAGLERDEARRRGSASEPVYLGSRYGGIVYHQWYTTRSAIAGGRQVDDVPPDALATSLDELIAEQQQESRDLAVIVGVRAGTNAPLRLRNLIACLKALNVQSLARWRYRIIAVEQDSAPQLVATLAPLVDRHIFAYNPAAYNRGWAFNIGALNAHADTLCLIDADLLVPYDFLERGLNALSDQHRAVQPYREVLYLEPGATERLLHDRRANPKNLPALDRYTGRVYQTSQGGCMWIAADLYRQVGGHDERFRGWGSEDREFWRRLSRATSILRLDGRMAHLYHERPAMDDSAAKANRRLLAEANAAPPQSPQISNGNVDRYRGETHSSTPAKHNRTNRRDWERWDTWATARIERIVYAENQQPPTTSLRYQLATIVTELGKSVLDVGCGPGALWKHLPREMRCAGIDITPSMLETARRFYPHMPVMQADSGCLPFADGAFDCVLLSHLIEHLPEDLMRQTLNEAARVARNAVIANFHLTPGGNQRLTRRIGAGFLETRWTREEITNAAGIPLNACLPIIDRQGATNSVWVFTPQPTSQVAESDVIKITIVMPTFRRGHTILHTIKQIQAQTYSNWELIIIDNAGDGVYEFADPRIRVYRHNERPSAAHARNMGLRYASGHLVCFFDDDDDMFADYLESFVATFNAHPLAKMVRCGMIVSDGSVNYTYATPECCLRREYVTPTWNNHGPGQDQRYFRAIIARHRWTEGSGDIVTIPRALCRAVTASYGGLRSGTY